MIDAEMYGSTPSENTTRRLEVRAGERAHEADHAADRLVRALLEEARSGRSKSTPGSGTCQPIR